ncbi:MAG TPA: CPBP family intramembrane glutamic endopeptidase [Xanthobacteraceae bacterium]|nr:CPBP family intramembrane glutamic endopeptidase [Xanthobacteraceae bacterium]
MSEGMQSPHLPRPAPKVAAPGALQPLSGWATAGWALLTLLAWLAAEAVVLIVFLVRWFAFNPGVPIDADMIAHNGYLVSLAAIVSAAVQCAVVVLAIRRTRWPVADYLGLVRRPHPREVVFCLACVALLLVASDLVSWLIGHDLVPPFMRNVYLAARDAGAIALLLLAVAVAAPIGEEIVFRGFMFRGLAASRLGPTGTIVVTSAVWAAIHLQYDWLGIAQIFCLGLLFGWVRWRSGSTALTMLMHAACNLVATVETAVIVEGLS